MKIEELKKGERLLKEIADFEQIKKALTLNESKNSPMIVLVDFFTKMQNVSSTKRKEQLATLAHDCIIEKCNELIEKYNKEFEEL